MSQPCVVNLRLLANCCERNYTPVDIDGFRLTLVWEFSEFAFNLFFITMAVWFYAKISNVMPPRVYVG